MFIVRNKSKVPIATLKKRFFKEVLESDINLQAFSLWLCWYINQYKVKFGKEPKLDFEQIVTIEEKFLAVKEVQLSTKHAIMKQIFEDGYIKNPGANIGGSIIRGQFEIAKEHFKIVESLKINEVILCSL